MGRDGERRPKGPDPSDCPYSRFLPAIGQDVPARRRDVTPLVPLYKKTKILYQADRCETPAQFSALLRRWGIGFTDVVRWWRQREKDPVTWEQEAKGWLEMPVQSSTEAVPENPLIKGSRGRPYKKVRFI